MLALVLAGTKKIFKPEQRSFRPKVGSASKLWTQMYFNLIERYIFIRAAVATLVVLSSLVGVVWVVQAMRKLDIITSKGAAVLMYLQLTTLAVPLLILAIIPIALLVATIFTVNSLNSNSELVVINASGASSWVLVKPLLALALLCSILVGFVGHFVIAWSLVDLKSKAAAMQADLVSIIVQEGAFNKLENGLTFHIAKREAGGLLGGILISDERDKNTSIIYTAREGVVTKINGNSSILLKEGEIHQHNHEDGTVTTIKYDSYAFDLSTLAGKIRSLKLRPKERTTPALFNPDPNDFYFKKAPGLYRAAIHERFSEMLWPFAYVIIILSFAGQARSNRQSYGTAIFGAVSVTLMLRGLAFSAVSTLKSDPNAVYIVYALPLAGIILGSWFLIRSQPVSLPRPVFNWIEQRHMRNLQILGEWRDKYIRYRRKRTVGNS